MDEDKQHAAWAARIAAIGARAEQIKVNSAEHQWICRRKAGTGAGSADRH